MTEQYTNFHVLGALPLIINSNGDIIGKPPEIGGIMDEVDKRIAYIMGNKTNTFTGIISDDSGEILWRGNLLPPEVLEGASESFLTKLSNGTDPKDTELFGKIAVITTDGKNYSVVRLGEEGLIEYVYTSGIVNPKSLILDIDYPGISYEIFNSSNVGISNKVNEILKSKKTIQPE